MLSAPSIDQNSFKRILTRNVALPLVIGVMSAVIFAAIIGYLLSVLSSVEQSERVIRFANEASKLAVDQETGMRGFLLTGEEVFLAPYNVSLAKAQATMATLQKMSEEDPAQLARLNQILGLQAQWQAYARESIELRRNNGNVAELVRGQRGKLLFDAMREQFNEFLTTEQRRLIARNDSAQRTTRLGVALYLFVALALGGIMAWFGRRDLLRLSATFGEVIDKQRAHADALERQAWQRSGQTALAERSIGQQGLARLGAAALEFIAEYTGAAAGILYAREEDGSLRRIAGYGAGAAGGHSVHDEGDEQSLVGQAFKSRRPIVHGELPDHYLKIRSGLGEAAPRHLVLIATDNDSVPNGVIELGYLQLPPPRTLEFLELVAPNVGRGLEGAMARRRLQDALAETQQLNEELQVQQEELRTANEELEE